MLQGNTCGLCSEYMYSIERGWGYNMLWEGLSKELQNATGKYMWTGSEYMYSIEKGCGLHYAVGGA